MRSVTMDIIREKGFIDPAVEGRLKTAPETVRALATRWAVWYSRRIDADSLAEIEKTDRIMNHAEQALQIFRPLLEENAKKPHLRLVS